MTNAEIAFIVIMFLLFTVPLLIAIRRDPDFRPVRIDEDQDGNPIDGNDNR